MDAGKDQASVADSDGLSFISMVSWLEIPARTFLLEELAMKKWSLVFLGGTCGRNSWREGIVIPGLLARGVAPECIYNPVVSHWDAQAQAREDAAKASPDYLLLYVLASPDPATPDVRSISGYSLAEAIMSLYDAPNRTVVLFDTTGQERKTAKGMRKAEQDLRQRFPRAPIFTEYAELVDWLAMCLPRSRSRSLAR